MVQLERGVFSLAESLNNYMEYLSSKNKSMKLAHSSLVPVRNLSQHKFLKKSSTPIPTGLIPIQSLLLQQDAYTDVLISDHLPSNATCKYRFVEQLVASGLEFTTVPMIYSPGRNHGNLYFMWRVGSDNPASR